MTVQELIKELQKLKQDSKVVLVNEDGEEYKITDIFPNGLDEAIIGFEESWESKI